ncbi:putative protein kinase-like domain superfamily [Plasmopara halstedii]
MARKWFQVVSEDDNALTSAAAVIVSIEDVETLRHAVKERRKEEKKELEEDSPIGSYGATKKDALIVQVPQRVVAMDVRGILNRVQVQFATGELNYLLNKDPARYSLLQSPALTSGEALQIRTSVRSAIKSVTRNAIRIRQGVLLDGPLNLSQGQAKSAFYYAYSRFVFQREVDVNFALGSHANIVQFLKSFSTGNTENEQRHIIVMPFFARCAADLLTQQSPIELRALITIAHDCFEALCHIHSKKLGGPIVEVTDQFCLDVAKLQGSELLDWTCLGTTLAQLANIDITKYHSRQDLVRSLKDGHEQVDHLVGQLIISCLENPSETRIQSSAASFANLHLQICRCSLTKLIRSRHHCRIAAIRSVVSILVENCIYHRTRRKFVFVMIVLRCTSQSTQRRKRRKRRKRRRVVLLNIDNSQEIL